MRSRAIGVPLLLVSVVVAPILAGCNSKSPVQPSSTDNATTSGAASGGATNGTASVSASIGAPRPVLPAQNAPIRNQDQPVTLVVQNAVVTRSATTTYTFQVATDAGFANVVQTKDGVAEGGGGQTSVQLDQLAAARDYFWRARGTAGSTNGVYGPMSKFTIGPAITVNPPTPIAPTTGGQTGVRPTFTVANAGRSGPITGAITYRFEIADNAAFNPITLSSGNVPESAGQTSYTPPVDLTAGKTYSWRAYSIDQTDGITSAPSAVQVFTPTASAPGGGGSAADIAAQEGVILWPGAQPMGSSGRAKLGGGWDVHTESAFFGGTFQSPTIEELRIFDLLDRGYGPQDAIDWMHANGYGTSAAYFPGVGSALGVIGFSAQYMSYNAVSGAWDLVKRVGA